MDPNRTYVEDSQVATWLCSLVPVVMPLFWLISSCCMSICVIKLISRNDFIYNKWTIRTSKSALLLHNDRDKTSNCELIIWSIVLETKEQYSGWDKGAQGEQLEEEERDSCSNMEMHSLVVRGPNIVHGVENGIVQLYNDRIIMTCFQIGIE